MNVKVIITIECDSEIVGEVLAAANLAAKKRGKDVVCTSVEPKKS